MKRLGLALILVCLGAHAASAQTPPPAVPTFPASTLSVDLRPGPAVWKEEYWDVKPEKADEFVAAYRREIYAVARKIPGYRGYTVLTLITSADDPPLPKREGADRMVQPHYALWTGKKMLTERQINVGVLYRQTHNFLIIHHFQTWADADRFPAAFAAAYAKSHNGQDVVEGLRKTVFPLSNNYWETYFRLVKTGFPPNFTGASAKGDDADGLNLEPHPQPVRWVKEFFLLEPQDLQAFLDAADKYSYAAIRKMKGTSGMAMVTALPPGPGEAQQTAHSKEHFPWGPEPFLTPARGVMLDGTIPLDMSANFSTMFRNTFNVVFYEHQQAGAEMLMSSTLDKAFAEDNPGQSSTELLQKHFFPLSLNHWDLRYRMIETSFSPGPAK